MCQAQYLQLGMQGDLYELITPFTELGRKSKTKTIKVRNYNTGVILHHENQSHGRPILQSWDSCSS